MESGSTPSPPTIIEERSWYQDGYCMNARENLHDPSLWYQLPYRRFSIPWKNGRIYTPIYRRIP
jgi:hypothetical protein